MSAYLLCTQGKFRRGWQWTRILSHIADVNDRDMADLDLDWDVEGIIPVDESVRGMLKVISTKTAADSGTFWCWNGRVSPPFSLRNPLIMPSSDRQS